MFLKDHPNVVKLFEVIDDKKDDNLLLVMEYCQNGPLFSKTWWKSRNKKHKNI
jgi:serine/threonine protein kinase